MPCMQLLLLFISVIVTHLRFEGEGPHLRPAGVVPKHWLVLWHVCCACAQPELSPHQRNSTATDVTPAARRQVNEHSQQHCHFLNMLGTQTHACHRRAAVVGRGRCRVEAGVCARKALREPCGWLGQWQQVAARQAVVRRLLQGGLSQAIRQPMRRWPVQMH